ncbi:MAG: MFS transporter, partial [Clostridia bacterium]|nr:MFS transporter [Clostridia bacterium]
FGGISDRSKHRWGKRKPFIFYGTIVAIAALMLLSAVDYGQLGVIKDAAVIDDEAALGIVYDKVGSEELTTPEGKTFVVSKDVGTREQFIGIKSQIWETRFRTHVISVKYADGTEQSITDQRYKTIIVTYDGTKFFVRSRDTLQDREIAELKVQQSESVNMSTVDLAAVFNGDDSTILPAFKKVTNSVYTNYVAPARQQYVNMMTKDNSLYLILFVVTLLVLLIAMSTFRSPAVALMPDVTVKPLRSNANAVINLMGTLGGVVVLVLGMGFAFNNGAIINTFRPYVLFFGVVALVMGFALAVFMTFVKETKWSSEAASAQYLLDENDAAAGGDVETSGGKLSKGELVSLLFILASVALWFMGYNAVTSKYSVYATNVLDLDYSTTLLVANAAALVSYLPVGLVASKIGRKKTILAGVAMLAVSFFIASFMRVGSSSLVMNLMFALAGIGWATINVNSFPMVVELSKNSNVGKYTGFYYAASMAAQVVTPMFSGLLMDKFGMTVLFPYATAFVILAFVTMLFVRHGDSKPLPPADKLEALAAADD